MREAMWYKREFIGANRVRDPVTLGVVDVDVRRQPAAQPAAQLLDPSVGASSTPTACFLVGGGASMSPRAPSPLQRCRTAAAAVFLVKRPDIAAQLVSNNNSNTFDGMNW
eukprot:COSAG01_NODE_3448_length_6086_cov_4.407049_1_plen_109_part_10